MMKKNTLTAQQKIQTFNLRKKDTPRNRNITAPQIISKKQHKGKTQSISESMRGKNAPLLPPNSRPQKLKKATFNLHAQGMM